MNKWDARAHRLVLVGVVFLLTVGFGPAVCREQFQVNPVVDERDEEGHLGAHHAADYFVVVWEHWEDGVPGSDVMGQRFNILGNPEGSAFQVNSSGGREGSPAVAVNSSSQFVVVWMDDDSEDICARKYGADGSALSGELVVAGSGDFIRTNPAVAMSADGAFMVVWEEREVDPDEGALPADIWARYFNASATGSSEAMVNLTTAGDQLWPSVIAQEGGGWVVAWEGGGNVLARRYVASGSSVTSELTMNSCSTGNQGEPALAALPGGGYVAVWRGPGFGTDDYGIQMRSFSATDVAAGPEIQVNFHTAASETEPAVAADSLGNLAVIWQSDSSHETDDDSSSIHGQLFLADGRRHLQQFQVNTNIVGAQVEPTAGITFDNGFPNTALTVCWTDVVEPDPDTTEKNIQAKVFDLAAMIFGDDFETGDLSYW